MDLALKGEVVVITGSTGGIGKAICKGFLNEGAIVVPLYRGDHSKLDDLLAWAKNANITETQIVPISVNIKSTSSVKKAIDRVNGKFGKIDVLINCVGLAIEKPFLLMEEKEWDEVVAINLTATTRVIRVTLEYMFKAKKGSIINISSVLGTRFGRGASAYATSKAAIDRLTQTIATEVGQKGIRVNSISPGLIKTRMSDGISFRLDDLIQKLTALKRPGKPEEVAQAVLFLASEKTASFITGHRLVVDGGISI